MGLVSTTTHSESRPGIGPGSPPLRHTDRGVSDEVRQSPGPPQLHLQLGVSPAPAPAPGSGELLAVGDGQQVAGARDLARVGQLVEEGQVPQTHGLRLGGAARRHRRQQTCRQGKVTSWTR